MPSDGVRDRADAVELRANYRGEMDPRMEWARSQVELRLSALGRRYTHSLAVAERAAEIGEVVVGRDAPSLILAGLLHDIGYAPELSTTGFHPLDGARFLRDQGYATIAPLVAHHTGARNEAKLRFLPELEDEFTFPDSLLERALTYCDLTVDPEGRRTNVAAPAAEIVRRYGDHHVVSRGVLLGLPEFLAIEDEIEGILSESPVTIRSGSR
jgi:hypothetical protein